MVLLDSVTNDVKRSDRTQVAGDISKWLITYREQNRLTQAELGKQIGCSQPVVARMEIGEYEPRLSTLRNLSKVLGVSILIRITPEYTKTRIVPKRK